MKKTLGRRIKGCRKWRDFTQESLAKEAGVSRAYINQLENGRSKNPSVWTMLAISKAFKVDVEALVDPSFIIPINPL